MSPVIRREPAFDQGKTFIIENVFVDYSSVFRPNTRYRPEWATVIRVPQHLINDFYEVGFRLKQDPNGQVTLRAKRYVRLDDGTEMAPPQIVDCDGNPWPESRGLIGNGSRCNVKVRAKYTTYQGVEGLSCFLEGIQILDHVPYQGDVAFGRAQGTTGGHQSDPQFTPQHQQAPPQQPTEYAPPAVGGGYAPPPQQPQAAHQQPQSTPPGYAAPQPPAQPQQQGFVPQGYGQPQPPQQPQGQEYVPPQPQQPQQPQQGFQLDPQEQMQPEHQPYHPPAVPQGPPSDGNVSHPQGALGGQVYEQQTTPPQQTAEQSPSDWVPPTDMGDTPF